MEKLLENKHIFAIGPSGNSVPVIDGAEKYYASVVAPIISEGDTIGSVIMVSDKQHLSVGEVETKLCQSAAGFLGKHMETT